MLTRYPAGALPCSDGGWCVDSYIPSLETGDTDTDIDTQDL